MIKAIIFDIGGVMFDETKSTQYSDIAKAFGINPNKFIETKNKYMKFAKVGDLNADGFIKKIAKTFNLNEEELKEKWIKIYKQKKFSNEMIQLVQNLKKNNYKVIVLSNSHELHAKINYERGLYSNFDKVFLSNELKIAKPDRKIYKYVLKKLKLKPEECVFIDDKEDNVRVAKELNINGIIFKDYKSLITGLKNFNITLK